MNGKKARSVRKAMGVRHVRLVPYRERWIITHILRLRRDGTWGPRAKGAS